MFSSTGYRLSNASDDEGGGNDSSDNDMSIVEHLDKDIFDGTRLEYQDFTGKLGGSIQFRW